MTTPIDDVLEDLVAEYDRLESILESLTDEQWRSESDAPGWTVTDVMIHLAQTEEGVVGTTSRAERAQPPGPRRGHARRVGRSTSRCRARRTRRRLRAMEGCAARDRSTRYAPPIPTRGYVWAHTPLKPRTLATTRLAEHWAHAIDVTAALRHPAARHRPAPSHRVARAQHAAVWLRVQRPGGARCLRRS